MKWDDAWLHEHESRMAALRLIPARIDLFEFRLPKPFKLLNETMNMHWSTRHRYKQFLARQIAASIDMPALMQPMQRARVTITRYSLGNPDWDNVVGGSKHLVDCLIVRSKTHPTGLGIIVDDDPEHLVRDIQSEVVLMAKEQRTEVKIERIA